MRTVRLLIAFQGTHYGGWQSQRTGNTVQEIFEKHLARILKEKVALLSSSRTDRGVHAKGLVAHFRTKSRLPDPKIKDALNYYLPQDIVVLSAKTTPPSFHARYSAKSKTYQYDLWNAKTRPSYDAAPFALWYPHRLDIRNMRLAAGRLRGRHDFSSFRDSGEEERDPVRRVDSILIRKKGPKVSILVRGNGFLRHMVRVIAGTLLEVGRGKLSIKDIESVLKSKDRKKAGPTVKPQGLTLLKVQY